MLQQTQTHRVAQFYRQWLKKFPSFNTLARSSRADVLRAWSGLGYNNRAIRLHTLAKILVDHHRGILPNSKEKLQTLPGIGAYTAHATACFAFGESVPVVDVNVKRVLTRWTKKVRTSFEMLPERDAWILAENFLPGTSAYDWNQALMDFGALVCRARNPQCAQCPVQKMCRSAFSPILQNTVRREKQKEPSHKGIPRRRYRGKILTLLHQRSLSPQNIASALWKKFSQRDLHWLNSVLQQMGKDGLLEKNGEKYSLHR
jgi:A/G-specific adenine glycosylase